MKTLILFIVCSALLLGSCGQKVNVPDTTAPVVVSTIPANNAAEVPLETTITVVFDEKVIISSDQNIEVNGEKVSAGLADRSIKIFLPLKAATDYTVKILPPTVKDIAGNQAKEVEFSFSTTWGESAFNSSKFNLTASLCTKNPSKEAVNVYNFLKTNFGKKVISGAKARINWNIEMAQWMFDNTGKYPSLNSFDYVHLAWSPANWIDYSKTEVVEKWWEANGLVAAMWHWNVPKKKGDTSPSDMAFYTKDTEFDIIKAFDQGSYENEILKADLTKIAGYLKLLKDKDIPVIWRPLHEAAGGWFWWGAKGPEPCVQLWKYMYDFFQEQGLNNLIWVWTTQRGDMAWYPGDAYVDILGVDIYVDSDVHSSQIDAYDQVLRESSGKRLIALSECGGVPDPAKMYTSGDMWSWFMPWYGDFTTNDKYNGAKYMKYVMNSKLVITRDQMPSLK